MLDKTNDVPFEYSEDDLAALQRALDIELAHDPRHWKALLRERPWHEVAESAAYSCQIDSLGLRPWQDPPIFGAGDDAQPQAAALLDRMLAAGVSQFEPNPAEALRKAERE